METLEASRMCRLCGNKSGISINIFDEKESHVRKINAVLPIMVHEMDLLPKHMCHRCSYKLEEFHKFYVDCLKTDAHLKSQLSWMRKEEESKEKIGIPMVHIENVKIKVEPVDYDAYDLDPIVDNVDYINAMSSMTFPVNARRTNGISEEIAYTTYCRCCYDKKNQRDRSMPNDYRKTNNNGNDVMGKDNETRNTATSLEIVNRDLLDRLAQESKPNVNDAKLPHEKNKIESSRRSNILTNPLIRTLRPRKNSVDYVGTKKKSHHMARSRNTDTKMADVRTASSSTSETNMVTAVATATIKIEKEEKFEGRALRPRKGTIDYIGRKKRKEISENDPKDRISRNDKRQKLERKISLGTKVEIKQEIFDELDDIVLDNSEKTRTRRSVKELNVRVDASPSRKVTYDSPTTRLKTRDNSHLLKKLKSLPRITRNTSKSSRSNKATIAKSLPSFNCPLKYLRSHGVHLRSGKIKKFTDDVDTRIEGTRRDAVATVARQRVDSRNSVGKIKRNLLNVINGTLSSTKVPTSVKLIGTNVKHYCERCNISFVNNELFKLHGCYA